MNQGYFHRVNPEEYPLYGKRGAKEVTPKQLKNQVPFVGLRYFKTDEKGNLVDVDKDFDAYTREFELCDVVWPRYTNFRAENYEWILEEVKRRGMYIGGIWGFITGSYPTPDTSDFGEFSLSPEICEKLEALGDQFVGYDCGEQDGRYIGSYAPGTWAASDDRRKQYMGFQEFFQKHNNAMHNNMLLLASLTFLHTFAKDGTMSILGAETAQALPNVNLWCAYLRGASKQYGLLWFANVSVWNRWGSQAYIPDEILTPYREQGVNCGSSLSLMRQLMYLEYMYGADMMGFEANWLLEHPEMYDPAYYLRGEKNILTPVGILQEKGRKFTRTQERGVMYTPVCIYLDFFNGFSPARHLYTKDIYCVWGNHPYSRGDYQLHALYELLYPGYEDAGFFRSEKGFLTPTPNGDMADILFSDVQSQVLEQYQLAIVCGEGSLDAESQGKLRMFVQKGGRVLLFGNKLDGLEADLLCEETDTACLTCEDTVLAREKKLGHGSVINLLTDGLEMSRKPEDWVFSNEENKTIPQPYRLNGAVKEFIEKLLAEYHLMKVDNPCLGWSLNELAEDHFILTVTNPRQCPEYFNILGEGIISVKELKLTDITPDFPGYFPPEKYRGTDTPVLQQGTYQIGPRDIRLLEIRTGGPVVREKPATVFQKTGLPPLYLRMEPDKNLKESYLSIPWLDNYFAGVKVEASYLESRDIRFLKSESDYLRLRNCDIIVDFSALMNHYPDMTLLRHVPGRTEEDISRIRGILEKSKLFGCTKAIITLQRNAENNIPLPLAQQRLQESFREIAAIAKELGITLYLQNGRSLNTRHVFSSSGDLKPYLGEDYRFAYHLGHGIGTAEPAEEIVQDMHPDAILLSAPDQDIFGRFYGVHRPVSSGNFQDILENICVPADFICLDANYSDSSQIYRDYTLLRNSFQKKNG